MYKQVVHLHVNRSSNHVSAITDVDLEPVEPGLIGDLDDLDLYVFIKDMNIFDPLGLKISCTDISYSEMFGFGIIF